MSVQEETSKSADKSLLIQENDLYRAAFSALARTLYQIDITLKSDLPGLSDLPCPDFVDIFTSIRQLALILRHELDVPRFGLVTAGSHLVSLIPLHGVQPGSEWKPIMAGETVFHGRTYPGYISSKNGKKMDDKELDGIRDALRAVSGLQEQEIGKTLIGKHDESNLFARLIKEEISCWKYYDTPDHVAFLTPFPNTTGYSCVIPKSYFSSDILAMPEEPYRQLLSAGWEVAQLFRQAFQVKRVGFMMEGYEINHAHLKVVPIWEGEEEETTGPGVWFEQYPGYLTTQKGRRLRDGQERVTLEKLSGSLTCKLTAAE
jgi:diadenosine tetraphosphate (Ap4A) HIT family hydrolase